MQTVLLVDAAAGEAAVLASALRVDGFHVVVASSAQEVREVLAAEAVVVAIIDLMIRTDGGNGLELARELKTAHPSMRVFLTSAYHLSERQLERADCGVSGFIPKPYDVVEVVTFLRQKVSGPPSSRRLWHADPTTVGRVTAYPAPRPDSAPPSGIHGIPQPAPTPTPTPNRHRTG
ncbi:MAG: response regulator [Deltaproteobacteria bacterium]|nr:response regulator [Deltaproteobacteria bacterium]